MPSLIDYIPQDAHPFVICERLGLCDYDPLPNEPDWTPIKTFVFDLDQPPSRRCMNSTIGKFPPNSLGDNVAKDEEIRATIQELYQEIQEVFNPKV